MKKIIAILIVLVLGWHGNQKYRSYKQEQSSGTPVVVAINKNHTTSELPIDESQYKCDGRTYCSQMTSCEEAKFFLKNCPNPKMDGNNDGVPCEQQWCK
jgi:hypothetical protein